MTRTDRRRFPVLIAAVTALVLAGGGGVTSPVQAQETDTVAPVFESARTDGGHVIVTFS